MPTDSPDLAHLKALAEKAKACMDAGGGTPLLMTGMDESNAALINLMAAVKPGVVLTLLASLTQKDEEIARLREIASESLETQLRDTADELRRAYAERDALKAENERLIDWRSKVTVALGNPGGTFYDDVATQVRALVRRASEDSAACICGCPLDEHETYGEDGESCGNETHECFRVSASVAETVNNLRQANERLTECWKLVCLRDADARKQLNAAEASLARLVEEHEKAKATIERMRSSAADIVAPHPEETL